MRPPVAGAGNGPAGKVRPPSRPASREFRKIGWRLLRSAAAAGVMAAILAGCRSLPNTEHATVALLMVAATGCFAIAWGWVEAASGALAGAVGLAYFFLPPAGLRIANPEHVVALATFLLIAVATGQLAAWFKRLLVQRNSLLNLSPDPLCVRELNGNFRSANDAIVKILGWSEPELRSRSYLEFVHPDDRARTQAAHEELLDGRSAVNFENRYRTKDGNWRWLNWTLAPAVNGESRLTAAARDVTEEKIAREKLRDLAAQLMTVQDEERRRIARELHDEFTQRLATLGIELGLLQRAAGDSRSGEFQGVIRRLQNEIFHLSDDLRQLSHSLHPSMLEYGDLPATLDSYCAKFTDQHGIAATFAGRNVPAEIPNSVAVALFRIAQESLHNIAAHSGATIASVILAGGEDACLSLFVIDNGTGFDPAKTNANPGLGLLSIRERARNIGAAVTIDSAPGSGTRLAVILPAAGTRRSE